MNRSFRTTALALAILTTGAFDNGPAEASRTATFTHEQVSEALQSKGCAGLGLDVNCPHETAECDRIITQFREADRLETKPQSVEPFEVGQASQGPFAQASAPRSREGFPVGTIGVLLLVIIGASAVLNGGASIAKQGIQKLLL